MAISLSYPGVYVQEVASSVHTIVGVPTSVAAFVGAAERGVMNEPVQIFSWADYQRQFGPLNAAYPMSWAAYLFFNNGGATAHVVRAGRDGAAATVAVGVADPPPLPPDATKEQKDAQKKATDALKKLVEGIRLQARSPGAWGSAVSAVADQRLLTGEETGTFFNLTVTLGPKDRPDAVESYRYLRADHLEPLGTSKLVQVPPPGGEGGGGDGGGDAAAGGAGAAAAGAAGAAAAGDAGGAGGAGDGGDGDGDAGDPAAVAAAAVSEPTVDADSVMGAGAQASGGGIFALTHVDIFNMLCLPTTPGSTYSSEDLGKAAEYCQAQRAVLIVDPPKGWRAGVTFETLSTAPAVPQGRTASNCAVYYPNLLVTDTAGATVEVGPCGAVAGVWAATDASRGVWKAPAGTQASVLGVSGFSALLDDADSGLLNPLAVNALRVKPAYGPVVWGARTAAGSDRAADEWKYLPVRRTALFIEESLRRATEWVVFEPNDEPLWSSLRLNVGVFMHALWRQGAFQGTTPSDAYFVKCDRDVNPQDQINLGIVNIVVGFAPLKVAEFVVISIEQLAGQLQT